MVSPSNQSSILLSKKSRFTKDQPQQQQCQQMLELNTFSQSFLLLRSISTSVKSFFFIKKLNLKKNTTFF